MISYYDDPECGRLYSYDTDECPVCGNRAMHPVTGNITTDSKLAKALEESMHCCRLIEVVDEGGSTLGYHIICRKER